MVELVEFIVKQLVDNKDAVSVTTEQGEGVTIIRIRVADEDLGKVIGRNGKIANSIRSIVHSASMRQTEHIRYIVKIGDDLKK
jgi:uncharacterized protein